MMLLIWAWGRLDLTIKRSNVEAIQEGNHNMEKLTEMGLAWEK